MNVTAVSKDKVYAERYRNHVMWQGQNRSVLFTMLGSVQSCHLVEATTIGQHLYKAITIIPFGDAWRKFQIFLGKLYGQGQMRGPFEFGCVLTLSSRREGYSTPGRLDLRLSDDLLLHHLLFVHRCLGYVVSEVPEEEPTSLRWFRHCSFLRMV